jgi:TIGR03009 family protein
MRYTGFGLAVLLGVVGVSSARQPAATPEAKLQAALDGWEKAAGALTSFRYTLTLKRTNPTFPNAPKLYSGSVLCMKPSFARLRLAYDADKTGNEYEAFICNGKAVYEYNGLAKTVTEWKLPDPKANAAGATDNLMLDLLAGMKAKAATERFDIAFKAEDDTYIYLNVKPKLAKDKAEFQELRLALYKVKTPYLPAGVYLVKPSGDTEEWSFKEPLTDIPNVTEKEFQYVKVDGFRFQEGKPPAPTAVRPGTPTLPATVRP